MARRRKTKVETYRASLVALFRCKDGVAYESNHHFTAAQRAALVPNDIVRFLKLKAYGNPDADVETDHPTAGRSASLEFAKKAISFFIPMRNTTWNPTLAAGNPTRSVEVNELIKAVKKREVRKQGAPSQARRELEPEEFLQTNSMLNAEEGVKRRFMLPAASKFQFHMVARVDDVAHFKEEDLKPNRQFDFALLARMGWSKNVLEERDAPDQIILGSFNADYCCLLGLAIYLESWKESDLGAGNPFLFGDHDAADTNKEWMSNTWREIWSRPDFIRRAEGPLGTHSNRKFPATFARRQGCEKDDIDSRGRWRKVRIQDRYVSANLPYPDAKVAAALCIGGPCKYELLEGSGITREWLRGIVVRNMHDKDGIHDAVADTLALPLLWAAMDDDMEGKMPTDLRNQIRAAYNILQPNHALGAGVNPVRKRLLIVSGQNAAVHIVAIEDGMLPGAGGANIGGAGPVSVSI